jgi:tRNA-splicing ligase RtcB (3'-phosphate/5'-hydroxy nucleic acid ligase)
MTYKYWKKDNSHAVKAWVDGVLLDENSVQQINNVAAMPFIHKHVAVMPDAHYGKGATVGTVIATSGAIIPAAVGVDIGCGMMAVKTTLKAEHLPDDLKEIRTDFEAVVPVGFNLFQETNVPKESVDAWLSLDARYKAIIAKHPKIEHKSPHLQLGTLGGGNHFIELCLDTEGCVWVMLHSGSRGVGNRIGTYFIEKAKEEMEKYHITKMIPDSDLSYLVEHTEVFDDYMFAMNWAQEYAMLNREVMMKRVLSVLHKHFGEFESNLEAINCHHNYVSIENHFDKNVMVTRKGAVRARQGDMGIIPGSMGAKSFIVKGRGNKESFCSCSHGAGRVMSRTEAKKLVNLEDHIKATEGVECRKDEGVIDETPSAYKDIDAVMKAQEDLVEIVHTLKQIVCVKG